MTAPDPSEHALIADYVCPNDSGLCEHGEDVRDESQNWPNVQCWKTDPHQAHRFVGGCGLPEWCSGEKEYTECPVCFCPWAVGETPVHRDWCEADA